MISWLHLTDLHCGAPGERWRWPAPERWLLEHMREWADKNGPPDLILFTGDLAWSGTEYDAVDDALAEVREAVGGDPLLVPVPGNHDLARPKEGDPILGALKGYNGPGDGKRYLAGDGDTTTLGWVRERFAGYRAWMARSVLPRWEGRRHIPGRLDGDFVLSFEKGGISLALVGLNTAWLHLGDTFERLAVEPEQLPLGWQAAVDRHCAALLLARHPPRWLHDDRLGAFEREVFDPRRFAALLCGHLHNERVESTTGAVGRTRHMLQAPSLLGIEDFGTRHERRVSGYAWGRLVAEPGGKALVEQRTFRLSEHGSEYEVVEWGGPFRFDIDLRSPPQKAGPVVAVVSAHDAATFREAVARRLEALRRLLEVHSLDAADAASASACATADRVVAILSLQTGGTDLLARLRPTAEVLVARMLPEPSLDVTQMAAAIGLWGGAPAFDKPDDLAAEARRRVAAWLDAQAGPASTGMGATAWELGYLEVRLEEWTRGTPDRIREIGGGVCLHRDKLYVSMRAEPGLAREVDGAVVFERPADRSEEASTGPFIEALLTHPRLPHAVVRAEAGMGKTVLLQQLAWVLARAHLGEPAPGDAHRLDADLLGSAPPVPLFLRAAALARAFSGSMPGLEHVVKAAHDELKLATARSVDSDLLRVRLEAGRYLLQIDSLDEVPLPADRQRVVRLAGAVAEAWPACRLVLTTRPAAETGNLDLGRRLRLVRIAPLDDKATALMVDRWCAAQGKAPSWREAMRGAIERVRARYGLPDLVTNPLMLTATMVVYAGGEKLPDSSAELFDAIVGWLCKSKQSDDAPWQVKRQLLGALFEGAQRAGGTEYPLLDAERALQAARPERYAPDTGRRPRDDVEMLSDSTALLRIESVADTGGRPVDVVRPWHKSAQQYLAAERLAQRDQAAEEIATDLFKGRSQTADEPDWRAVLRFMVGIYAGPTPEKAERFVRRLRDHALGAKAPRSVEPGFLLATACEALAEYRHLLVGREVLADLAQDGVTAFEAEGAGWPVAARVGLLDAVGILGDPRMSRPPWVPVAGGPFRFQRGRKLERTLTLSPFSIALEAGDGRRLRPFRRPLRIRGARLVGGGRCGSRSVAANTRQVARAVAVSNPSCHRSDVVGGPRLLSMGQRSPARGVERAQGVSGRPADRGAVGAGRGGTQGRRMALGGRAGASGGRRQPRQLERRRGQVALAGGGVPEGEPRRGGRPRRERVGVVRRRLAKRRRRDVEGRGAG